jgi:hypothetical protein
MYTYVYLLCICVDRCVMILNSNTQQGANNKDKCTAVDYIGVSHQVVYTKTQNCSLSILELYKSLLA